MITRIDHLVHVVRALDSPAHAFGHGLGLYVTPGGEHPGLGTHNSLVYFDLSYCEFLGVTDFALAAGQQAGREARRVLGRGGEGLCTFAVGSDDLEGDVAAARARGCRVEGPHDGSRIRPDGAVVRWRTYRFDEAEERAPLPFVIQHGLPDWERRGQLKQWGAIATHPLAMALGEAELTLAEVAVAVDDLGEAAAAYRRCLGVDPGRSHHDDVLGGRCIIVHLREGSVVLVQPGSEGPARESLARVGPGPCLWSLGVPDPERAAAVLVARGVPLVWRQGRPLVPPAAACGTWILLVAN